MMWFLLAALLVTAVAAWTDWQQGTIPNWLTYGVMVAAPFAHVAYSWSHGATTQEIATNGSYSVLGGFLCGLVPLLLYNKNAIGGGDVKLFVAIGMLCRPMTGVEAEMYSFFAAMLIAPIRLAYEGKLFRTVSNAFFISFNSVLPKTRRKEIVPQAMSWFRLGPAILAGVAYTTYLHWRAP